MAFGSKTIDYLGGAVNDLFTAEADQAKGDAALLQGQAAQKRAEGANEQAQASYEGDVIRSEGDIAEASNYMQASSLADLNANFTEQSTAIQQVAADRAIYKTLGTQRAQIGGYGGTGGGSGFDLLADSASQGALTKALVSQQGLITEAGYKEQSQSFQTMAGYATWASGEELKAGADVLDAGKSDLAAGELDLQAGQSAKDAADVAARGADTSSIFKGVAAVASLFLP